MSPEERKRWRKLLSQQEARVQVNPASIRQFGPFRGAVREGSAQGRVEIPGTTPASETSLGRMASALSGVSGLMNQYNDYLFKKEEIAQRGKALEFEKFSEGEKLKQVNQSIASIGLATKAVDERIIQQDLQNDRIALDNLDMYQDKLLADLDDEGLFNFAHNLQDLQERQRKRVEAAEHEVSKDKDIRDDLLADERMHLATGARLSPLYKSAINQRVKDHLESLQQSEIPLPTNKEDIKEMIRGWAEEWLEEKKINPSSSVARGLLETTQQFNLEVLEKHAESIMTAAEEKDSENTARDLNDVETAINSDFQFLPEDIDTTHTEAPASGEETEGLIKALGGLNPKQQSAVTRELKKHGVDLPTVVDSLLNPQIETEDPPLDPEGIGTNSPTSAQVRMGISIALQAVEKFTGDEEAADITNSVAFKNYSVKPQGRQMKTLNNYASEAIAEGSVAIQKALINLPDILEKSTWDGEKASEHRVGYDLITRLDQALVQAQTNEANAERARNDLLEKNGAALAIASSIPRGEEDLTNFRTAYASLFSDEGLPTTEEIAEVISNNTLPSEAQEAYLASFKQLSNTEAVLQADKFMESVISQEAAQLQDELSFAKNQTWWTNVGSKRFLKNTAESLLDTLPKGSAEYKELRAIYFAGQGDVAEDQTSVRELSDDAMRELNSVVSSLTKQEKKLSTSTVLRIRREAKEEGRSVRSGEIEDALRVEMEQLWDTVPDVLKEHLKERVKEKEEEEKEAIGYEKNRSAYFESLKKDIEEESGELTERVTSPSKTKQRAYHVDTDGDGEPDSVVPAYSGRVSDKEMAMIRDAGTRSVNMPRRRVQPAMLQVGNGEVQDLVWDGPRELRQVSPLNDPKMLTMAIVEGEEARKYLEHRFVDFVASHTANKLPKEEQRAAAVSYLKEVESYHSHLKAEESRYYTVDKPMQKFISRPASTELLGSSYRPDEKALQLRLLKLNHGEVEGLRWFLGGIPGVGANRKTGHIQYGKPQDGEVAALKDYFTDLRKKTENRYKTVVDAGTIVRMVNKDKAAKVNLTRKEAAVSPYVITDAVSILPTEATAAFRSRMQGKEETTVSLPRDFISIHQPLFEGLVYTDESKSKNAKDSIRYTRLSMEQVKTKLGASDEQLSDIALMFGFKNKKGEGDWDSFQESQMQRPEYEALLKIGALRRK